MKAQGAALGKMETGYSEALKGRASAPLQGFEIGLLNLLSQGCALGFRSAAF